MMVSVDFELERRILSARKSELFVLARFCIEISII